MGDDAGRGADVVRLREHLRLALGMRKHERARVSGNRFLDLLRGDDVVTRAIALVEDDVLLGHLLCHIVAQVLVRDEQDVVLGQLGDDVHGIGGGHADVAPALDFHGRVHIAHDGEVIAILLARGIHRLALDHVRHGTIRRGLGEEDVLVRVEELRALAHELDAREHDRALRQRLRELCQIERVAHVVRHRLDLGSHIVVREDHGISLRLETLNGGGKLGGNKRGSLGSRGT